VKGSRDLLFKFWDPFISRERLKLETSNLAQIGHWGPKRYNAKVGQQGSWRGHLTYFLKFWDPLHISETVEKLGAKVCIKCERWKCESDLKKQWHDTPVTYVNLQSKPTTCI